MKNSSNTNETCIYKSSHEYIIFNQMWEKNSTKLISFFENFTLPVSFQPDSKEDVDSLKCNGFNIEDFKKCSLFTLGVVSDANKTIKYVVLCCSKGVVLINSKTSLSKFFESIHDSCDIIGVDLSSFYIPLMNLFKFNILIKNIDSMQDYMEFYDDLTAKALWKRIVSSTSDCSSKNRFYMNDVIYMIHKAVIAYYYTSYIVNDTFSFISEIPNLQLIKVEKRSKTQYNDLNSNEYIDPLPLTILSENNYSPSAKQTIAITSLIPRLDKKCDLNENTTCIASSLPQQHINFFFDDPNENNQFNTIDKINSNDANNKKNNYSKIPQLSNYVPPCLKTHTNIEVTEFKPRRISSPTIIGKKIQPKVTDFSPVKKKFRKPDLNSTIWANIKEIETEILDKDLILINNGKFSCKGCHNNYNSYIQLLEHCFQSHM